MKTNDELKQMYDSPGPFDNGIGPAREKAKDGVKGKWVYISCETGLPVSLREFVSARTPRNGIAVAEEKLGQYVFLLIPSIENANEEKYRLIGEPVEGRVRIRQSCEKDSYKERHLTWPGLQPVGEWRAWVSPYENGRSLVGELHTGKQFEIDLNGNVLPQKANRFSFMALCKRLLLQGT